MIINRTDKGVVYYSESDGHVLWESCLFNGRAIENHTMLGGKFGDGYLIQTVRMREQRTCTFHIKLKPKPC